MLTLQVNYTRIILVIGMEEKLTDSKNSNQEEQLKKEPDREEIQENSCDQGNKNEENSEDLKKIERCEPCLHCGWHCIYLNRE